MKHPVLSTFAGLFAVAVLPAQDAPAPPPPPPVLAPAPTSDEVLETIRHIQIEIKGPQSITVQEVQALLTLRVNESYDVGVVIHDKETLWRTGKISSVEITPQRGPSGFTALVTIIGRGELASFEVTGNAHISTKDLMDDITLKKGHDFGWVELNDTVDEIRTIYHRMGYPEVVVSGSMSSFGSGSQGQISITVEEGVRQLIRNIRFSGLTDVTADELGEVMQQKNRSARLPTPELEKDFKAIARALKNHGYAKAEVKSWSRTPAEETDVYDLIIILEQGALYRVKSVFVKGNETVPLKFLDPLIQLRPGAVYSYDGEEKDSNSIGQWYFDHGYADVDVTQESADVSANEISLNYAIKEGPRYTLDRIRIFGLRNTHEDVIWRELAETGVRPGDFLSVPRLKAMEAHFKELNYLSNASFKIFAGESTSPENPVKDIHLMIEEKTGQETHFGGGFFGTNAQGYLKIENTNFDPYDPEFFGAGLHLKFEIKLQTDGGMLDMSLGDRDFFGQTLRLQLPDLEAEEKARALKTAPEDAAAQ